MSYSPRQQRIISLIAERGNISAVEFLLSLAVESREVEAQQWQDLVIAEPGRFQMFIPQWNHRSMWLLFGIEADAHHAVVDYLAVVRDLLSKKLISVLNDPKRHVRPSAIVSSVSPPAISDRDRAAVEADALLQSLSDITQLSIFTERVYALPSLSQFISNGYKNLDEVNSALFQTSLQRQLRSLARLSLSSVVIALCLIILVIWALFYHRSSATANVSAPAPLNDSATPTRTPPRIVHDTLIVRDTVVRSVPAPVLRPRRKSPVNTDEVN